MVCLQECLKRQYDDILWILNEKEQKEAWVGVFAGRDDGKDVGEACAIIWRKDDFYCERTTTFWLSETPDKVGSKAPGTRLPRIATACVFKDTRPSPADDAHRHFALFNCHLDHEVPRSRALGIDVILAKTKEWIGTPTMPVVICGDFNALPSEDLHHKLQSAGFIDAASMSSTPNAVSLGTFHNWTGDSHVGPSHRIDYIYARPPASDTTGGAAAAASGAGGGPGGIGGGGGSIPGSLKVEAFIVDPNKYPATTTASGGEGKAILPSDHFPVIATLRF
jgi:endonuclease/exonuclease/phosphatase family metal-dependent hydrolase